MRTRLVTLVLFAIISATAVAQADVFATLGSNETEAREQIFSSFSSGFVTPAGTAEVFKVATAEGRAAIVRAVIAFARSYSTSADFTRRYATFRDDQKPAAPEAGKSGDQLRAEQRQGLEAGIANAQKMAKERPAMKKDMDHLAAELKKQLAQLGKDKTLNKQVDETLKQANQGLAAQYQIKVVAWEKKYPADPKAIVVLRLKEFLAESATVDFAAKTALSKENKKQVFINPDYELKPMQWKMMYRAGKPAVEAARAAAQDWLKALGG
ncbi:MAG: hypothetical protein Q7R30_11485 [Acidobacteriota bacterium]|nr:hypothetical protein [Acidobacteriota bacterium]